ncbi:MAG: 2-oxoacid:ferredoxin oxidoreductase subunit beta [Euryarchaeota archaeon]|nr:2-oxoacid:ferredoxin oxidoreductase subunit beta [Euryarchaeota archaeon]
MKLATQAKIVWCPGCGNFGILKAFKDAVGELEVDLRRLVLVSGVGCHGKIADYLALSSFHTIHGRVPAMLAGIKLANPELIAVGFAGDGDAYNEGLVHLIHAAKKNIDATLIVHDNAVYGLTTGQATATSARGFRGRSTPEGNPEEPLNPVALMLASGASFVARGYAGDASHLKEIIKEAILHRGFAFVDVLQPCVTFNNTWKLYREKVHKIKDTPESIDEAMRLARAEDEIPVGILYREERSTYEEEMRIEPRDADVSALLERMR